MPQRSVATNYTFEQQRSEINLLAADFWSHKTAVDGDASTYLKHDGSNDFTGGTLNVPAAFTISSNSGAGTLTIAGNLQVNGTTTTVNTATMDVVDKNITIAKGSANDAAADGAGITVDSPTNATWNFVDANDAWVSSIGVEATTFLKGPYGQFTGSGVPTTGQGVEVNAPDGNTGQIISYDRGNSAYKDLRIKGSSVGLYTGTSNALIGTFNSTGLTLHGGAPASTALLVTGNYDGSNPTVDIQTWQRTGGAVQAKMIYKDASTDMHFGTDTAHTFNLITGGSDRIKIASNSAATSIGGAMAFNAMLTVQGDVSGSLLSLKAAENTSRFNVSGTDGNDVEVNLYDKDGTQRGILVGGATEFAIKAPNNASPLTFYTHNGTSIGERMRLSSDGKFTIGTSPSSTGYGQWAFLNYGTGGADATDGDKGLVIRSDTGPTNNSVLSNTTSTLKLINNAYTGTGVSGSTGTVVKLLFNGATSNGWNAYGAIGLDVQGTSGGKGDLFFNTGGEATGYERLRIKNTGHVLIGTTTTANAHANADDLIIGDTGNDERSGITIVSDTDKDGAIHFSDGTGSAQLRGQIVYGHTWGSFNDVMVLYTAGTKSLHIQDDGDVILGEIGGTTYTESSTEAQLRVVGDASAGRPAAMSLMGFGNTTNAAHARINFQQQTTGTNGQTTARIEAINRSGAEDASDLAFYTEKAGSDLKENLRLTNKGEALLYKNASDASIGTATNLSFDSLYLGIGENEGGINVYRTIGLGWRTNTTSEYPASMGCQITDWSGNTKADLVFATRNTTGQADVATERLRIKADGVVEVKEHLFMGRSSDPKLYSGANVGFNIDGGSLYLNRNVQSSIELAWGGGPVNMTNTADADVQLNIYKQSGADTNQAILRIGYDANNNYSISRVRNQSKIICDSNQTGTYVYHRTESKDTAILTPTQVFATAKHASKVTAYSGINTAHWGDEAVKKFYASYYTGANSATYHVARMISQTDWGFGNLEIKVAKYQYNPTSDDLNTKQFTTYYGSHSSRWSNYNQQSSGSGTGAWNVIDWNQNFGPSSGLQIHNANNGGYYRDCYGSDIFVNCGVYTGIRLEFTIWASSGTYDCGDYATAQDFYPAPFGGQASQTDADNWNGPRGTWFNSAPNGTGQGTNYGLFKFSTGQTYGEAQV